MIKRKNKGNMVLDGILVMAILLFFAICVVIGNYVNSEINSDIQADNDLDTLTKTSFNDTTQKFPTYMDNGFIILLVLLWIFMIISSYYLDTLPILFVVNILLLFILIGVSMVFSNAHGEFIADADISSSASEFPKMNYILSHLAEVFVFMIATVIIALYGKSKE